MKLNVTLLESLLLADALLVDGHCWLELRMCPFAAQSRASSPRRRPKESRYDLTNSSSFWSAPAMLLRRYRQPGRDLSSASEGILAVQAVCLHRKGSEELAGISLAARS